MNADDARVIVYISQTKNPERFYSRILLRK
jgi:hypothetical protein